VIVVDTVFDGSIKLLGLLFIIKWNKIKKKNRNETVYKEVIPISDIVDGSVVVVGTFLR
jgi:hypothetical protein